MNIVIIDYQLSNLFSVKHACDVIGVNSIITSNKKDLEKADAAILPGVGAFPDAMNNLRKYDLVESIKKLIISGKPFMGVCLGMQLLFSESDEFGAHKGLDVIQGKVTKFKDNDKKIKVPQIGWNKIYPPHNSGKWIQSPLQNIAINEYMYFVHSYYVCPGIQKDILSLTEYEDIKYCSSILRNNVFAAQFHPEKSGPEGIKIYRNWVNLINS